MAVEITLTPADTYQDTHIDSSATGTSFHADADNLDIGERNDTGGVRRGLFKFPIVASLPEGSEINTATLRMRVGADKSDNARTWRVYRVMRKWWDTSTTWNTYDGTNSWGTAGCENTSTDREASDIGNESVPNNLTVGTWIEINLTTDDIQEILDGDFTDNGFLVQVDTENNDAYIVGSYEGSYPSQLVISYTPPGQRRSAKYLLDFWGDEVVLYDRKGHRVQPWEVEPDEWGMCTGLDFPSAKRPTNYYADSGMFYIEGVDYRPPTLSITTDINDFADQLMRRLAGGG